MFSGGDLKHDMKDDKTFVADLSESVDSVWETARLLSSKGHEVTIPPTIIRPTRQDRHKYSDDGDLRISFKVEVKCRPNIAFTNADDFPYQTIIVDECHLFDRHKVKPIWYFIWNADKTAFAFVDVRKTRRHWRKVTKKDNANKKVRDFYECPVNHITFHQTENGRKYTN